MKDHRFRDYIYWGVTAILVIISCILFVMIFIRWETVARGIQALNAILAPITYGAILAYLMAPVYNYVQKAVGKKLQGTKLAKAAATLVSLVSLVIVCVSLFLMIIPQVWESIRGIVNSVPTYIQVISRWIQDTFANYPQLEEAMMEFFTEQSSKLIRWTQSAGELLPNLERLVSGLYAGVKGIINLVKNLFIGVIVMVYLLNIKDTLCAQIKKVIYGLFSVHLANSIIDKTRFIHKVFGGFIIGKLLDSLIIGILTFVLLTIVKMPYTLLISVIVGVTNIIPFFGPFIGAIPSAMLLLLVSPKKCLIFLVLILLIQQFDGNILGPKILGESTGVSSFWVLFSILLFGGVLGPVGMIIGVPTFAVLYRLVAEFIERRLTWKHLSTSTDAYRTLNYVDEVQKIYVNHQEESTVEEEEKR